jgi:hypothetical protein
MFVTDRLVYLQLHKTGCTRIAALVERYVGGHQLEKHKPLEEDPGHRFILGSVRNPWAWYVSLWAYGCHEQGMLQRLLTSEQPKGPEDSAWRNVHRPRALYWKWRQAQERRGRMETWKALYASVDDPALFRRWVSFMFSPEGTKDLREGFAKWPFREKAGLMTFRYVRLYWSPRMWTPTHVFGMQQGDLISGDAENNLLDGTVRNENLGPDLVAALVAAGHDLADSQKTSLLEDARIRINDSRHLPYSDYYDDETIDLIATRERLIIDKYGYQPPPTSAATP